MRAAVAAALFVLVAGRPARAADPDPWLGPDKALHCGASAAIAGGGYAIGAAAFDGYPGPVLLGAGLSVGAGLGKEVWDAAGHGTPSVKDLAWGALGTALGIGVSVAIHAIAGGPSK